MSRRAAASSWLDAVLCTEFLLSPCTPLQGFLKQVRVVAVTEILFLPTTLCTNPVSFKISQYRLIVSLPFTLAEERMPEWSRALTAGLGRFKVLWPLLS